MPTIHFHRYQMLGAKRWKKTNHRMNEETGKKWFAMFGPHHN
ncbi:hypothetical protein [Pandoraea apista]|nr:hypothetical protein [Pandoraea apista]